MVVDAVAWTQGDGGAVVTVGASQTQVANDNASIYFGLGSYEDGATTTTMSWSWASGNGHWAHVAASLKAQ
jgi:hypothetical protein